MNESNKWESIKIFFINFGSTLKKSAIWLIISYIIPILNILILFGIHRSNFKLDLSVISIIIATNSCIITSLLHLIYLTEKKRELTYVLSIVTIILSVALFVLCLIQLEMKTDIMRIDVYKFGAYLTLSVSIFLLLISKYDEVQATSSYRAEKGKKIQSTDIDGQQIKL